MGIKLLRSQMGRERKCTASVHSSARSSRSNAFTLLEMLLAISLTGILLGSATFLLTGLTEIWVKRANQDSFEEHADGVAFVVQSAINQARLQHQPTWSGESGTSSSAESSDSSDSENSKSASDTLSETLATHSSGAWSGGLDMEKLDESDMLEKPGIHFNFFHLPAWLGADAPPASPGVEAWLRFEKGKGLGIIWKDTRTVQNTIVTDQDELLRACLISPHVKEITYLYLDQEDERWKSDNEPIKNNDSYELPDMITLSFELGGKKTERTIIVKQTSLTMPLF